MSSLMNDPIDGVPEALKPHVFLLSNVKYPPTTQMPAESIVDYLLQAPSITRHSAPMYWSFLECPKDGSVLLVWQSVRYGTETASDGYVWTDQEQAFSLDSRGCTVEMYLHRQGYNPARDVLTLHCRRRFRLTKASPGVAFDPQLWLIHYSAAEPAFRVPVHHLQVLPATQQLLVGRRFVQSQGQLIRKEFMLYDRNNWPVVNFPQYPTPPTQAPFLPPAHVYSQVTPTARNSFPLPPFNQPQAPPAPHPPSAAAGVGPPPSKRARTIQAGSGPSSAAAAASSTNNYRPPEVTALEEEEDTSRGDFFDNVTERELRDGRFKKLNSWMEEVITSPYNMDDIEPPEMDLIELMERVISFNANPAIPYPTPRTGPKPKPGTPEHTALVATLREQLKQKTARDLEEMERDKKAHEERMKPSALGVLLMEAERKLRQEFIDPSCAADYQPWEIVKPSPYDDKVDEIVAEVEKAMGKKAVRINPVTCVRKGGMQDATATAATPQAYADRRPAGMTDIEFGAFRAQIGDMPLPMHEAAHLASQRARETLTRETMTAAREAAQHLIHQTNALAARSGFTPEDVRPDPEVTATLARLVPGMTVVTATTATETAAPTTTTAAAFASGAAGKPARAHGVAHLDVEMGGMGGMASEADPQPAPTGGHGSGEGGTSPVAAGWVVVANDGGEHPPLGTTSTTTTEPVTAASPVDLSVRLSTTTDPIVDGDPRFENVAGLKTAGDAALANFGDVGLSGDDSAFGDAMHGTEMAATLDSGEGHEAVAGTAVGGEVEAAAGGKGAAEAEAE